MERYFANITIQSKDDDIDWRSFCICRDEDGNWWELRGYGESPEEAAKSAWEAHNDDDWALHGYTITPEKET